jgi:CRP-like cAMP-binding protein
MPEEHDRERQPTAQAGSAAASTRRGGLALTGERGRNGPGRLSHQPPPPPPLDALTRKLAARTTLSPAELTLLGEPYVGLRTIAANRDIISEGYKYDALFVLLDGAAIRYRVLHDGRRQILNIVLPGDFIGFPACFFDTALYSVTALTDAVVWPLSFSKLFRLLADHPRVGAAIFWLFSCEAAMYAERVIALGQRSAAERLAHFLLELLTRMRVIGLADERLFRMPLTQEQIGDILGLTGVHVSRTLRQLRDDGLVGVEGQLVSIRNLEALSALADFERTYLNHFRMSDALLPGPSSQ